MYNGWPNKETWLVNLWLSNEPVTEAYCREIAARKRDVPRVADALREWIEGANPLLKQGLTSGLYADLLSTALGHVDWDELARHICEW